MVLAGNKLDLCPDQRTVDPAQAHLLAQENCMQFFETSARTGDGIDRMMQTIFD